MPAERSCSLAGHKGPQPFPALMPDRWSCAQVPPRRTLTQDCIPGEQALHRPCLARLLHFLYPFLIPGKSIALPPGTWRFPARDCLCQAESVYYYHPALMPCCSFAGRLYRFAASPEPVPYHSTGRYSPGPDAGQSRKIARPFYISLSWPGSVLLMPGRGGWTD